MNAQTYFVMQKSSTGTRRIAWTSPTSGDLYCGVCLRGTVSPKLASSCATCGSKVVGRFSTVAGGVERPGYAAIRAEKKKREAQKAVAADRTGNLLVMRAG